MPSDRDGECRAHVAEGDIGDLPFAIPQQRRLRLVLRLAVQADGRLGQTAPVVRVDAAGDLQHAVDRRLEGAGKFGHHHVGEAAVAAEDRSASLLPRSTCTTSPSSTTVLAARQRIGRNRRRCEQLASRRGRASAAEPRSRSGCGPRRGANSRPVNAAEQRLDRVVNVASARPRRTRADPGRSTMRSRGRGWPIESSTSTMKGTDAKIFFSFVQRPRGASPNQGRRSRRAASPAPADRAAPRRP